MTKCRAHHEWGQQKPAAWSGGTRDAHSIAGVGPGRPHSFLSSLSLLLLAGPSSAKASGWGAGQAQGGQGRWQLGLAITCEGDQGGRAWVGLRACPAHRNPGEGLQCAKHTGHPEAS